MIPSATQVALAKWVINDFTTRLYIRQMRKISQHVSPKTNMSFYKRVQMISMHN